MHRSIIFIIAVSSVLVFSSIILGLVFGLRQKRLSRVSTIEICGAEHETYKIEGSSKLGKYARAAVAVDNEECSRIGKETLQRGGTTVDAAIAASLCNGVLNAHSMGIGGGCVMVVYSRKRRKAYSIVDRETAPLAAGKNMFVGRENMSTIGALAIATPGELLAYRKAYDEFGGGVAWSTLFDPTISLCENGFKISIVLGAAIKKNEDLILNDTQLKEIFVKNSSSNELYKVGDMMKRIKLARTLRTIAREGVDTFYKGALADKIVKEIQSRGGILSKEDLRRHRFHFAEAVPIQLNGSLTAFTTPAPSNGPILTFILNVLFGYSIHLDELNQTETAALYYHRLAETFKFAYAKRSEMADPLKVNVTELIANLTSKKYADSIRNRINDNKTYPVEHYRGNINKMGATGGTAHISIVGEDGDAVAITSTINTYFGSMIVGAETGIIYNNEMDDFATPNTTNYFAVPASPVNYIAPGKRPLSSQAPLIVVDDQQRVQQVLGASGGTRIPTSVAQVALLNLRLHMDIKAAIDRPRIHHQLFPQEIMFEEGFDHNIVNELQRRGHNVSCTAYGGSVVQGIERHKATNEYWANCDIRKGGSPDGY